MISARFQQFDEKERTKQWNELYEYAKNVRKAAADYFDKKKVSDLVSQLENTSISENIGSDSGASESKT